MNFTARQSLNIIQLFLSGLVAPIVLHDQSPTLRLSVTAVSVGLCAASWAKSRFGKDTETTDKSNLNFLSGNKAWQLQLMLAPFSVTLMTVCRESPIALTAIVATLFNIELLRQTELLEAKKQLSFFKLLEHRMFKQKVAHGMPCDKEALIDWYNRASERESCFQTLSFDVGPLDYLWGSAHISTWHDAIQQSFNAGHIQNKNGHLHVILGKQVLLEFKDGQYKWYGLERDYPYYMQFLCAEHFSREFQKLSFCEIMPKRDIATYLQQISQLTSEHNLSSEDWYESMLEKMDSMEFTI